MGRPRLYTDEERLEKRRERYRQNREREIARQTAYTQRVVEERKALLSQFCCRGCGETDPTVIQWHHMEPSDKEFELFRAAWAVERFWDEVLKCIPLCANCHLKIHNDTICLLPQIR